MGVWTDKKIEKLKDLWKEGISTAEIGKRLGFSKNAIVGKVNRLGLEHRTSPIKTSAKPKKIQETKSVSPSKTTSSIEQNNKKTLHTPSSSKVENKRNVPDIASTGKIVHQSTAEGVHLIDLTSDRCCWPIDDGTSGDFCFCGKKVFKGKPYCLEHCTMAYTNSSVLKDKDKKEV